MQHRKQWIPGFVVKFEHKPLADPANTGTDAAYEFVDRRVITLEECNPANSNAIDGGTNNPRPQRGTVVLDIWQLRHDLDARPATPYTAGPFSPEPTSSSVRHLHLSN